MFLAEPVVVYQVRSQVGWALDRLCELDGARWVYDSNALGAIRRDVMTILTHHAARRRWPPMANCCSPATRGERFFSRCCPPEGEYRRNGG